jgi:chromosome partitioning protein
VTYPAWRPAVREGFASRIKRILSPGDDLPSGGRRAQVIAISNQKGGVGKTTTAVNLGAGLVLFHQKKVLLIDLDAQGHVSVSLQRPFAENGSGISTILSAKNASILDAVAPTEMENLDITLSDRSLIETEGQLAAKIGREFILRRALSRARTYYDIVLIDCPPNLGNLTVNAYVASDRLIIPCELSALALEGMEGILDAIDTVQYRLNHPLKVLGILPTRVDHRNVTMNEAVFSRLRELFGDKLFKTQITVNTDLNKAQMLGKPIFQFAPGSTGAQNYQALADEVVERIGWGTHPDSSY